MAVFTGLATAIGGLLSSTFLSGAIGGALLKMAVGIGLSLLARALNGKKTQESGGVKGQIEAGGDVVRSLLFGRTCTAGSLAFAGTWGNANKTPNSFFTQVIALADHPIKAMTGIWVNGEPVTVDMNDEAPMGYAVTEYRHDGKNYMWVRWYDGTQTGVDTALVSAFAGTERPYSNRRVGKGVAYAIVTSLYQPELFTGFPSFKFEVQGRRLYDVSKDSSAGGNGPQRWADRSTWGGDGDDLLAVQVYNLLRGITEQGKWLYGVQTITSARLPAADWIAQINKCRLNVEGPDGLEPQFVTGGEITTDTKIGDTIDKLLTGGNARLVETGGTYKIRVGEPGTAVAFITDDEIISTEEQTFTPFFGLSETVNGVTATYPAPEEGWATKAAPPLYNPTFEAQDGNRRLLTDVPMDFVYRSGQVQRLMQAALREARRARRHTFTLPPKYWVLEPGDIVSWTSAQNGYESKLMRVDGTVSKANLDATVDLTEVDPSDYDWHQDTDYKPPVFAPIGTLRPSPQPIVDFAVIADVAQDADLNNRRCALRLIWDGDQTDVDQVLFEVRLGHDLSFVYGGRTERVSVGSILIAPGILLPNTDYQVRGRYFTYSGNRRFEWSDWIPVRTLDIRLGPLDVYGIDIEQLNKEIQESLKWTSDALRYALDEMDRLGKIGTENDTNTWNEFTKVREQYTATAAALKADYTRAILVAVGPGSVIATRIESLEVKVNEDIAQAVDMLSASITTVDGRVTANAQAITALSVQVGDVSSSVTLRGQAQASPGGGWARWGAQVKTGSGNTWSTAAFYIDVSGSTSRFVVAADQFIVTNSAGASKAPLIFSSGVLALQVANIGDVTAGILRSPDNRVVFNLANATLTFSD